MVKIDDNNFLSKKTIIMLKKQIKCYVSSPFLFFYKTFTPMGVILKT